MFEPEKLPAPDEMGFFFHPDIPGEEESDDVKALFRAMGFEAAAVFMSDDEPDLYDEWNETEELTAALRWVPMPPNGDGWIIVAKFDTEDGPCAMFVRPVSVEGEAK